MFRRCARHETRVMTIPYTFQPFQVMWPPLLVVFLLASCATVPPVSLTNARVAYSRASQGPAAQYAPAELHAAKVALAKAEQSYEDVRAPQMTDDLAFAAESRAQNAEVVAARASAERKAAAARQREADRADERADASERRVLAANREAQEANDALASRAAKVEERGTVITLSESALFGTNDTMLLPAARSRLVRRLSGGLRPGRIERHRSLERGGAQVDRNRDRTAER